MPILQVLMQTPPQLINTAPKLPLVLFLIIAILSYLIGSINFGILISKHRHQQDVRQLGSGNSGMTNVLRNFGKTSAILTLIGDMGKGIITVLLGRLIILLFTPNVPLIYGAYIAAVFTIIGHLFPLFFGFKGGKGVATAGGVILALQPIIGVSLIGVFLIVTIFSKMVSLGAIIGMLFYPIATFIYSLVKNWRTIYSGTFIVFAIICSSIISGLVVWSHRSNIKRILSGTENKLESKKK